MPEIQKSMGNDATACKENRLTGFYSLLSKTRVQTETLDSFVHINGSAVRNDHNCTVFYEIASSESGIFARLAFGYSRSFHLHLTLASEASEGDWTPPLLFAICMRKE
ncbi:hypothetical protein [Cohnella rhizosphaerae]|uniref:Uncharacterized protein n=1 Tax=Cohnella rhizosphaerae TaxID=1457232 RepID=A0A9X4QX57_9BACL|nr:hypothetical protein [Cohnella rhizosphaerae]MDG0814495.1 hypothetical protein [Cohnella rhizosphaerae]